jgi:hypothetical protein
MAMYLGVMSLIMKRKFAWSVIAVISIKQIITSRLKSLNIKKTTYDITLEIKCLALERLNIEMG